MIDRTGPLESNLLENTPLHNTGTAVVLIMLWFMTFGVWHERDSGIAGGRQFWRFSQTRELKSNLK